MSKKLRTIYQAVFKGVGIEIIFCEEVSIDFPFVVFGKIMSDSSQLHGFMVNLSNVNGNNSFIKYRDVESTMIPHYNIIQIDQIKPRPVEVTGGVVPING